MTEKPPQEHTRCKRHDKPTITFVYLGKGWEKRQTQEVENKT